MARTPRALPATRLRSDLYRVLDRVVKTGEPAFIERRGQLLKIVPATTARSLGELRVDPGLVLGDPDALVHVDWSDAWKP